MKYEKKSKSKIEFKIQNQKNHIKLIKIEINLQLHLFIYLKTNSPQDSHLFYEMIANNCLINVKFFNNRLI